ncbi:hypothetical protein E1B28_001902 [Marasmius oreades]|uniref:Uncharacterized protein n=1 Tax=Marasmius oreades TaxID=181124 RepID=A0A9P8AFW6_9AGAR|nr:uncharacterized protein E1B28_001902 [Marasmius oreades]KAG7100122.1 hypothetical protein E1B28_001902 [Marasmius oreades]
MCEVSKQRLYPHWSYKYHDYMWDDLPPSSLPSDWDTFDSCDVDAAVPPSQHLSTRKKDQSTLDKMSIPAHEKQTEFQFDSQSSNEVEEQLCTLSSGGDVEDLASCNEVEALLRLEDLPAHDLLEDLTNQHTSILSKADSPSGGDPIKPVIDDRKEHRRQRRFTHMEEDQRRVCARQQAKEYYHRNADAVRERRKQKREANNRKLDELPEEDRSHILAERRKKQREYG